MTMPMLSATPLTYHHVSPSFQVISGAKISTSQSSKLRPKLRSKPPYASGLGHRTSTGNTQLSRSSTGIPQSNKPGRHNATRNGAPPPPSRIPTSKTYYDGRRVVLSSRMNTVDGTVPEKVTVAADVPRKAITRSQTVLDARRPDPGTSNARPDQVTSSRATRSRKAGDHTRGTNQNIPAVRPFLSARRSSSLAPLPARRISVKPRVNRTSSANQLPKPALQTLVPTTIDSSNTDTPNTRFRESLGSDAASLWKTLYEDFDPRRASTDSTSTCCSVASSSRPPSVLLPRTDPIPSVAPLRIKKINCDKKPILRASPAARARAAVLSSLPTQVLIHTPPTKLPPSLTTLFTSGPKLVWTMADEIRLVRNGGMMPYQDVLQIYPHAKIVPLFMKRYTGVLATEPSLDYSLPRSPVVASPVVQRDRTLRYAVAPRDVHQADASTPIIKAGVCSDFGMAVGASIYPNSGGQITEFQEDKSIPVQSDLPRSKTLKALPRFASKRFMTRAGSFFQAVKTTGRKFATDLPF